MRRWFPPALATLIFGWLFGLRGAWYSGDFTYRLQTEALLRGHLALQPLPYGARYDYAWGRGLQQVWGLGIPLLRLPFEAAAHLFGGFGFPDAIVFVLGFAAVALLAGRVFRRSLLQQAALLAVTLLCPAFINLCRTRFEPYEEAVGGGFLASLALGLLLMLLVEKPRPRLLLAVAALAGLAPWFRPTALAYSLPALGVALWVGRSLPRRTLLTSLAAFALGISLWLWLNQRRFGSPFETGHSLNVSYNPLDQYGKDFGNPYAKEPLHRAAAELFGALFLSRQANGYDFYRSGIFPLQSATPRFREFYFATFSPWMAAALLSGWMVVLVFRRRLSAQVKFAALLSLSSFTLLGVFYLRLWAIASRYLVDFAAAWSLALAALLLAAFTLLGKRASRLVAGAALLLIGWGIAGAWFGEAQSHRVRYTASQARDKMPHPRMDGPPILDHYDCPRSQEALTGIPMNGLRWSSTRGCSVQVLTPIYLPSRPCVSLRLQGETAQVRVKRGLTELSRVSEVAQNSDHLVTFCAAPDAPKNPTGIEIVFLGWSDGQSAPALRLLSVSAQ